MNLDYDFEGETRTLYLTDATPASEGRPVLLMLHGTGDTRTAWIDPGDRPDHNYDFLSSFPADRDVGIRSYPGVGIWSIDLDSKKEVRSWREFLEDQGFRVAIYSQLDNVGFLARPVRELASVIRVLTGRIGKSKIAIVGQSRGGILARRFIKDNLSDREMVGRISHVITLHSPHGGSSLANLANSIRDVIADLEGAVGQPATDALGWLIDLVDSDAFREIAVASAFLTDLANGEAALPGVDYHTFGGTSVRLTRVRMWVYTPGSAIPQWSWPPFAHTITALEAPGISPLLDSLPDLTAELTEGRGDMLVAEARSHLDWSVRHTNALNHAETLWDPGLQRQVVAIVGGTPGIWD